MNEPTQAAPPTAAETPAAQPSRAASRIAARLAREAPDPVTPDAESASDADGASPPATASGVDSASGASDEAAAGNSPVAPGSSPEAPTLADINREKLRLLRERRRDQRETAEGARARAEAEQLRAQADADAKAAAAERAKWESLGKDGSYLDGLKALGKDPRAEFERLKDEAIAAGTPEAMIAQMERKFEQRLSELVEPLKKTVETLTEREQRLAAAARERDTADAVKGDYADAVKKAGATYDDLLDAEGEEKVLGAARALIESPESFHEYRRRYNVRLTGAGGRYNMTDILNVLAAAQAEHDGGRAKRRAARTAANPSDAAPATAAPTETPTVNGTAAPRNAGTATIGNDLATARAAEGTFKPTGKTAAQRIRERTNRP